MRISNQAGKRREGASLMALWLLLRLPGQFDIIFAFDICPLNLGVVALDHVSIFEVPFATSLWFVVVEVAFEVGAVGVQPLSRYNLTAFVGAHVLHAGFVEDVSARSFLLACLPLARVDVLVDVDHDALSMPLAILPVAVILADSVIILLAYAVLLIIEPVSAIRVLGLLPAVLLEGVDSVGALAQSIAEITVVSVTVWIGHDALAVELLQSLQGFTTSQVSQLGFESEVHRWNRVETYPASVTRVNSGPAPSSSSAILNQIF